MSSHPLLRSALFLLVPFLGLCTAFVLVVTAGQAWQEHSESQWPQTTARIQKCTLNRSNSGHRQRYHIRCRVSYAIGAEQNAATLYSSYAPSPDVWQYPPNQIAPLEAYVEGHPPDTPVAVRYNPVKHTQVVLVSDFMPPRGGPKTPDNLKLLTVVAAAFLAMLAITRFMRASARRVPATTL